MAKKQKTIIITIIIAIFLVGAVVGAYFGYKKLSEKHTPSTVVPSDGKEAYKNFSMTDIEGKTVKLSDFIGQPVVINFWAYWCGPCKSELPHFDKLAKEYDGRVTFLMLNVFYDGKKEKTIDFVSQNGYTFPLYFDDKEEGTNAYDVTGIPVTVFITADGYVMAKRIGAMSEAVLRSYINQIL